MVSVGVEDEDGTVFEGDFDWLSGCEALVEQVETRLRIVVRDRFADGLPGRAMGSKVSMSKGGSGGGGRSMTPPPQSLEAEEEWDFSGADDGADALHGGLPTGALERVGAPDAEKETTD